MDGGQGCNVRFCEDCNPRHGLTEPNVYHPYLDSIGSIHRPDPSGLGVQVGETNGGLASAGWEVLYRSSTVWGAMQIPMGGARETGIFFVRWMASMIWRGGEASMGSASGIMGQV